MKKLLMTLAGLLAIGAAGTAVAADEKADAGKDEATTYVVEMTGVT